MKKPTQVYGAPAEPVQPPAGATILDSQGGSATPVPIAAPAAPQRRYESEITWPPGFAGILARHIEVCSYLPVKEVAITATLGLLAGVCGRAFETHTGKDLSLYIILVARSGIGKDTIHEAIPRLLDMSGIPGASGFLAAQDFASGPALHKMLLSAPGFLNLQGEFGRKLKRMSNSKDTPMQDLRTVMLDAYSKEYFSGKAYSDSVKSLMGIRRPALSFLGETTPGTFAASLTPDMMEDGFLSRFLTIRYDGPRPYPNEDAGMVSLEPEHLERWKSLIAEALRYKLVIDCPERIKVGFKNSGSYERFERFERECTDEVNSTEDESERQVWSRAHLKALKIASLLAVADNHTSPQIDLGHAVWGITLVKRDIESFRYSKNIGDVGNSDEARRNKMLHLIEKYLVRAPSPGYRVKEDMRKQGVITRSYLQAQVSRSGSFAGHKLGASAALDLALKDLVSDGILMEMDKLTTIQDYKTTAKCFRILSHPSFDEPT